MSKKPDEILPERTDGETSEENSDIYVQQDGFRHVVFGQIADGLIPPHTGPPESTDDELSRAALSDTEDIEVDGQPSKPTIWRVVFLISLIVISMAIVFWKK